MCVCVCSRVCKRVDVCYRRLHVRIMKQKTTNKQTDYTTCYYKLESPGCLWLPVLEIRSLHGFKLVIRNTHTPSPLPPLFEGTTPALQGSIAERKIVLKGDFFLLDNEIL